MTDAELEIPLNRGKVVLIDASDWPLVKDYRWYADKNRHTWYARANVALPCGRRTTVLMHRIILRCEKGRWGDHRDGDGLNNRRGNLRPCEPQQNCMNRRVTGGTSRFKGVRFFKKTGTWTAQFGHDGASHHIGYFDIEEDAARAYDAAARRAFGEFAAVNFPHEGECRALKPSGGGE